MRARIFFADGAIRPDRGRDSNYGISRQRVIDKADSPNVLIAVPFTEAEALRKTRSHDVTVENFDFRSPAAQALFQKIRDRARAYSGHSCEPNRESFVHGFWRPLNRPGRIAK
jgi:hypothetical protein